MRKRLALSIALLSSTHLRAGTQLLVPAYFDPSSDPTDWSAMDTAVSPQVPITAIMNPNSGPVPKVDSSYTAAISALQSAGGKVIAYVHTTNGQRSITAVENDIATYQSEYPNINGIFIDEMDTAASTLNSYYKPLYTYIKNINPDWEVVGNPGTSTIQGYLSPKPAAADVLVTFEDTTGYSTYTPSAWQANFPATSFGNIALAQTGVATMQADVATSIADRAGNVYFTDLGGTNPYLSLPTYWAQEVATVRAVNAPRATYVAIGSGDYNAARNWSSTIPNAIDAEADFLGAITANRTIYADTSITAGRINFNNSNSYVLAGAGSLTLQTSIGFAAVDAQAGVQKITLPITIASNTTFTAESGATLIIGGPVTVNTGQTLSDSGTGKITFLSTITVQAGGSFSMITGATVQSLILSSGSRAGITAIPSASTLPAVVQSLSLAANANLNLNGNDLIVQQGDLSTIQNLIELGRSETSGITSTASPTDSTHLTTVAAIPNSLAHYSSFDNSPVSASDTLIKYTRFGDTNLDGVINTADYDQINSGFISQATGWYNGDFNGDGVINGADYSLIDNAFNNSGSAQSTTQLARSTAELASPVPEPSALIPLASGALVILSRHRRSILW